MRSMSTRRGFTLVELVITLVIVAVLAGIAWISYNALQRRAEIGSLTTTAQTVDHESTALAAEFNQPLGVGVEADVYVSKSLNTNAVPAEPGQWTLQTVFIRQNAPGSYTFYHEAAAGRVCVVYTPATSAAGSTNSADAFQAGEFTDSNGGGLTCTGNGGGGAPIGGPRLSPVSETIIATVGQATPDNTGFTAIDFSSAPTLAVAPGLPDGLLFDPNTGVITGTPAVTLSPAAFTVTASNGEQTATASILLSVVTEAQACNPGVDCAVVYPDPETGVIGVTYPYPLQDECITITVTPAAEDGSTPIEDCDPGTKGRPHNRRIPGLHPRENYTVEFKRHHTITLVETDIPVVGNPVDPNGGFVAYSGDFGDEGPFDSMYTLALDPHVGNVDGLGWTPSGLASDIYPLGYTDNANQFPSGEYSFALADGASLPDGVHFDESTGEFTLARTGLKATALTSGLSPSGGVPLVCGVVTNKASGPNVACWLPGAGGNAEPALTSLRASSSNPGSVSITALELTGALPDQPALLTNAVCTIVSAYVDCQIFTVDTDGGVTRGPVYRVPGAFPAASVWAAGLNFQDGFMCSARATSGAYCWLLRDEWVEGVGFTGNLTTAEVFLGDQSAGSYAFDVPGVETSIVTKMVLRQGDGCALDTGGQVTCFGTSGKNFPGTSSTPNFGALFQGNGRAQTEQDPFGLWSYSVKNDDAPIQATDITAGQGYGVGVLTGVGTWYEFDLDPWLKAACGGAWASVLDMNTSGGTQPVFGACDHPESWWLYTGYKDNTYIVNVPFGNVSAIASASGSERCAIMQDGTAQCQPRDGGDWTRLTWEKGSSATDLLTVPEGQSSTNDYCVVSDGYAQCGPSYYCPYANDTSVTCQVEPRLGLAVVRSPLPTVPYAARAGVDWPVTVWVDVTKTVDGTPVTVSIPAVLGTFYNSSGNCVQPRGNGTCISAPAAG